MHRILAAAVAVLFAAAGASTWRDRLKSIEADSFPNHLYAVAAQSGGVIGNPDSLMWGCDTASGTVVQVMDTAAFALARDNGIPIVVFSVDEPGAIPSAILGQGRATYVMP